MADRDVVSELGQQRSSSDNEMVLVLVAGLVAGGLIGFVLGWLWVHHWSGLLRVRLLDVMTAVGTCGAVAVAVGLHREGVVRSAKEQRRRAGLYAVEMFASLQYFGNLTKALMDLNLKGAIATLDGEQLRRMSLLATEIVGFDRVRQMDLTRLDPLSSRISTYLAAGIGQILQGASAVEATVAAGFKVANQLALQNHVLLGGGFQIFELAMKDLSPEVDKRILGKD